MDRLQGSLAFGCVPSAGRAITGIMLSKKPHPPPARSTRAAWIGARLAACLLLCGCGDPQSDVSDSVSRTSQPPVPVAPVDTTGSTLTVAELRLQLGANDRAEFRKVAGRIRYVSLFGSGVTDITPLAGLPLKFLDLTGLPISDLSPLEGMPLEELYLENTHVSDIGSLESMPLRILRMEQTDVGDISPLRGAPLRQLNLYGTKVEDISAVSNMPLDTLWLTATAIRDLGVLRGKHLESLDIENTAVEDLGVLAGMSTLKRLNIAGCAVADVTPLAGLRLERLIFTPSRIEKGLDVVRNMASLRAVGTSFEKVQPPAQFWSKLDAGEISE